MIFRRIDSPLQQGEEERCERRQRGKSGAGLGLSIVGAVVAAHHGSVSAANAPGGGALFTVELPRAA